jgi:hypothetical protein
MVGQWLGASATARVDKLILSNSSHLRGGLSIKRLAICTHPRIAHDL